MALKIRKRLDDGTFGPEEEVFAPAENTETVELFEAIVMQQELLFALEAEIAELKATKGVDA